jgi:hypothetical protein
MPPRERFSDEVAGEEHFSEVLVERFRSEKDLARDHVVGRIGRLDNFFAT